MAQKDTMFPNRKRVLLALLFAKFSIMTNAKYGTSIAHKLFVLDNYQHAVSFLPKLNQENLAFNIDIQVEPISENNIPGVREKNCILESIRLYCTYMNEEKKSHLVIYHSSVSTSLSPQLISSQCLTWGTSFPVSVPLLALQS